MSESAAIAVAGLSKRFGEFAALTDVTFEVRRGEIMGFLGPNGAGKSTLMRILATITKATEGTITWDGVDISRSPDSIRSILGYLPQDFGVYPNLNAVEFLEYMAAIKGVDGKAAKQRIKELLEVVNLADASKRPLGGYSGGMKQRIGIAQALLNDPKLLIVDEPTVGLDPEERVRFRNLLSDLSGDRIVILSTHIVSDVEAIASDIALINKGELLMHATPEDLLRGVEGKVWEWVVPGTALQGIKNQYLVSCTIRKSDGVQVRAVSDAQPVPEARAVSPTLEDAYLRLISSHRSGTA